MPFAANATDPVVAVGPAHALSNPVVATANAPYVTVTPSTADESHIATTAYVKGAYNDAIAAVNKVDSDKQGKLMNMESTPQPISNNVLSSTPFVGVGGALPFISSEDYAAMVDEFENDFGDLDETLPTTGLVFDLIRGTGTGLENQMNEKLNGLHYVNSNGRAFNPEGESVVWDRASFVHEMRLSASGLADDTDADLVTAAGVAAAMDAQRVDIYTTWDTNATTQVPLSFAPAQQ